VLSINLWVPLEIGLGIIFEDLSRGIADPPIELRVAVVRALKRRVYVDDDASPNSLAAAEASARVTVAIADSPRTWRVITQTE
jgi:hypothetical protein